VSSCPLVRLGSIIIVSAPKHISHDQRIAEEAALWVVNLEDGEADRSAFAAWLAVSPRHLEEFLLASAVWRAADGLDHAHHVDVEQWIILARDNVKQIDEDSIGPSRAAGMRNRMRTALTSRLSVAAALLAAVAILWISVQNHPATYSTAVGEQRVVKLEDGSIVTLNTRSEIKVRFESDRRMIDLVKGEALFEVAHDASRPFQVFAGTAEVRAVGTRFNVERSASGTTVAVVDGIVEVRSHLSSGGRDGNSTAQTSLPERFSAGEQAQLPEQGQTITRTVADIDRVVAWRERRLIFRSEPLATIAAEFNRYNDVQLIVEGPATSARLLTGVFNADKPDALIAFLKQDPKLSIESRGTDVLIKGP
jgi:transmembrane sensor